MTLVPRLLFTSTNTGDTRSVPSNSQPPTLRVPAHFTRGSRDPACHAPPRGLHR
ncbi:MAG: hypothetical protein ACK559_08300 [bacterium]